ncbi:MAG: 16S rRNA (cytosine(1402)-N(4))-methyltransferase RsmH [Proteobacteria bacterium]|nr:16S rRNA (cytosine(1402)-N(4))-methyltransferase RsmH [Burkholderiales bacterium]
MGRTARARIGSGRRHAAGTGGFFVVNDGARHAPVLLKPALEALAVRAAGIYVDGTFGRGGHSRALLDRLGASGRLIAFDRDPEAIDSAREISDARLHVEHASFDSIDERLRARGIERVDGILLDLGVSSPQLDTAERGFSFRHDGPLDMRMDTTQGESAGAWLARANERDIREVIRDYGEERYAQSIARAIVAARAQQPITRTRQLAALVASAVRSREPNQDPATRTFQALRIHVNQELARLEIALPKCIDALLPAGRLVVISFHSLEDRIVKHALRDRSVWQTLSKKPITASDAEVEENPRARSAKLRAARRVVMAEMGGEEELDA